jgi:hypothetical protein
MDANDGSHVEFDADREATEWQDEELYGHFITFERSCLPDTA